jgi:hypothetical protein
MWARGWLVLGKSILAYLIVAAFLSPIGWFCAHAARSPEHPRIAVAVDMIATRANITAPRVSGISKREVHWRCPTENRYHPVEIAKLQRWAARVSSTALARRFLTRQLPPSLSGRAVEFEGFAQLCSHSYTRG